MTFEKIFQNTVLCQNTGKGTERTEVFDFRSENFHKINPKGTVMKSFLVKWQPATSLKKNSTTVIFLRHRANKICLK